MANKSWLLESVLNKADEMVRSDGKRGISADYFIVSLLNTVTDLREGALEILTIDEPTKEKARSEISQIDKLMSRYNADVG